MNEPIQLGRGFPITKDENVNLIRHFKQIKVGAGTNIFGALPDGVFIGSGKFSTAPFRVNYAGAVIATSGILGGWNLGATSLVSGSGANTVGLDSGGTNPAIYAGSATPASAPFKVSNAGVITAESGTVGGWTLGATSLSGGASSIFQTSSATNVERIKIDTSETNKRMFQILNSSNAVRGWIGKGEDGNSDVAISTPGSLGLSFVAGLSYDRFMFFNSDGIFRHTGKTSLDIGTTGEPFDQIFANTIRCLTNFVSADNTGGATNTTLAVRNSGDTGTLYLEFKNGLFVGTHT